VARLYLHVSPGAARNNFEPQPDGEYRVHLTARAMDGKANRALLLLLSDLLDVPKSRISIVRGAASRHKVIEVEDVADDELQLRLRRQS
jgi:uncharacterized protein